MYALSCAEEVDCILDPGAKMSTHEPRFVKDERPYEYVIDPTVMAVGSRAGEYSHASSRLELPAEVTATRPWACAERMA